MKRNISKYNTEGYHDPVTYEAMTNITKEEIALENKVSFVIKMIKFILRESGFELLNRIEIKDSKTGRVFR